MSSPHSTHRHGHASHRTHPCARSGSPAKGRLRRAWDAFCLILARNRVAIIVSSLLWLIWRSGSQPRRLSYPCQQAAMANLGVFSLLLVPGAAAHRHARRSRYRAVAVLSTILAVVGGGAVIVGTVLQVIKPVEQAVPLAPVAPPPAVTPPPAVVSIVRDPAAPTTDAEIESMVQRAVAYAGGFENLIRPGDTVVLKPNLVETVFKPGDGNTTDPRVTRAIVRLARAAGAGNVIIAEGTATSHNGEDQSRTVTRTAFRDSGYDQNGDMIDDETGAPLYDLNDSGGLDQRDPSKVTLVTLERGVIRKQYWVPNILLECDVLISVPTLKNHANCGVTLGMKNRIGCAPNDIYHAQSPKFGPPYVPYQLKWSLIHAVDQGFMRTVTDGPDVPPWTNDENLVAHYTIVDLNQVRPHDFVVVDGLVGITNGPTGTSKANPPMRLIMASRDTVALDTIGALVMGYDPNRIGYIDWGWNRGLGNKDTATITVVGEHVAAVRRDFPNGYGGTIRADVIPPTIAGTSLQNGPVVGDVTVTGWGISDVGSEVVRAELLLTPTGGGEELRVAQVVRPSDPFQLYWDSTTIPDGTYIARLTVYDSALNEAIITRTITKTSPTTPLIHIGEQGFSLTTPVGISPAPVKLHVRNSGIGTLRYALAGMPWMVVDLSPMTSDGETDEIEIGFQTETLRPGVYEGSIAVKPLDPVYPVLVAREVPVRLEVTTIRADLDGDGDVDQSDFGLMQRCLSRDIGGLPPAGCEFARLDGDQDVDMTDVQILMSCYSGPDVMLDINCMPD